VQTVDRRTLSTVPTAPTAATAAVSILPRFPNSTPKGDTFQLNTALSMNAQLMERLPIGALSIAMNNLWPWWNCGIFTPTRELKNKSGMTLVPEA
jgi:hypothetical protein